MYLLFNFFILTSKFNFKHLFYSHLYTKVVVVSKFPLPHYRFDLDDKRPQREVLAFDLWHVLYSVLLSKGNLCLNCSNFVGQLQVIMAPGMQKRVDAYLVNYISGKRKSMNIMSRSSSNGSIATDESLFEQPEPLPHSKTTMEKVFWRRSVQMHDKQRNWQVQLTP